MGNVIQFRPAKELKFEDVDVATVTLFDIEKKAKEQLDCVEILTAIRHADNSITVYTDLEAQGMMRLLDDCFDYPEI